MIFGLSVVERATKLNAALIHQIIEAAHLQLGRINQAAWRDPYFVGFFTNIIGLNSYWHFGDRATGATGGEILLQTWVHINGQQLDELPHKVSYLVMSKHPDFAEGAENAARIFFITMRRPNLEDPIIKSAIERGKQLSNLMDGDSYSNASAVLMNELFIERLRDYQD